MDAFVRSAISYPSNCSMTSKTWNTRSPVAVAVSIFLSRLTRLMDRPLRIMTTSMGCAEIVPDDRYALLDHHRNMHNREGMINRRVSSSHRRRCPRKCEGRLCWSYCLQNEPFLDGGEAAYPRRHRGTVFSDVADRRVGDSRKGTGQHSGC